ncbi:MAG: type II toxin-antitoxin system VapC family toxin [Armatimonadetes bacterium]|nr:type II toxin-antitoxin system VapC family toxin [Armatimonadota bacterium]
MGRFTLPSSGKIYVDTAILIYAIEGHPLYSPLLHPFWSHVHHRRIQAVTSELALLECLVKPLREGNADLEREFEDALYGPGVALIPVSKTLLKRAARLRAFNPSLRTPDAIHAATAINTQCLGFLANDRRFASVAGLNTFLISP